MGHAAAVPTSLLPSRSPLAARRPELRVGSFSSSRGARRISPNSAGWSARSARAQGHRRSRARPALRPGALGPAAPKRGAGRRGATMERGEFGREAARRAPAPVCRDGSPTELAAILGTNVVGAVQRCLRSQKLLGARVRPRRREAPPVDGGATAPRLGVFWIETRSTQRRPSSHGGGEIARRASRARRQRAGLVGRRRRPRRACARGSQLSCPRPYSSPYRREPGHGESSPTTGRRLMRTGAPSPLTG